MIVTKILYVLLLAGLVSFYILYIDPLPLLLLAAAVILPVILRLGLFWVHFRTKAAITAPSAVCTAGEPVSVTVTVTNDSPLFFPRGEVRLRVYHTFGTGSEKLRIKFPVQDRNQMRLSFAIHPARSGIVTAEIRSIRIYDMFRLFHTNVPHARQSLELLVLPKRLTLPLDGSAPPVEDPESIRFADKPGDDPSELFGIREYQPGDPVSRIHWKLSSRSDTLLLKQFGAPVDKHTLLLLEYACGEKSRERTETETFLTIAYSVSRQLLEAEQPCTLAWFDQQTGTAVIATPESVSELEAAFRELCGALFRLGAQEEALSTALGSHEYSSAIVLTNLPDSRLLGFLENSISANARSLLLVSDRETTLCSEQTEIHIVSPEHPALRRLTV